MSSRPNVHVAVVYHSRYGHTAKHAEAVAFGAKAAGAKTLLINIEDIDEYWVTLEKMDAIIFGCPTYMGSASGRFKMFMDATSRRVFFEQKWKNKVAAGFTNGASRSGDKLNTLQQLSIFAAQHSMHWVNLGLMSGHNNSTSTEDSLNRHGFFLGAAAQSDADLSAEDAATKADLATSQHLGARVATVALELTLGRAALRDSVDRPLMHSAQ
jgi:NAD(P)H dehydrogenase (quinone)